MVLSPLLSVALLPSQYMETFPSLLCNNEEPLVARLNFLHHLNQPLHGMVMQVLLYD
jgi:hypothetical protein